MIADADELRLKVQEAGAALQEISNYVAAHPEHAGLAKVRFPRGYLRTADSHRRRLPFIRDRVLRDNVSYALMAHDVLRWVSTRTDLSGQALEMITKEAVCLLGTICESISIYPAHHGLGRGAGFSRRIQRLRDLQIIDEAAQHRLNWLWAKRNQEHLIDVLFREWDHYTTNDWSESVVAYHALRDGLSRWHAAGFPRHGLV